MKIFSYFLLLFPALLLFFACNKDEGLGGSYSLEGYVYQIEHSDDNFSFHTDTFPAAKKDVYLIFGDNAADYFGDDVETDRNGLYRFDYLRKGNYLVYAYSELADGRREGIEKKVKVSGDLNQADPIFIHTGKAYGTAMIQGSIRATYYHNGTYRDEGLGVGIRAYISHVGEDAPFDDIRAGEKGIFIFQKLLPGDYIISVETENKDTEKVSMITSGIISIRETGKIYVIEETFNVHVAV
jgi:hypothetical protein